MSFISHSQFRLVLGCRILHCVYWLISLFPVSPEGSIMGPNFQPVISLTGVTCLFGKRTSLVNIDFFFFRLAPLNVTNTRNARELVSNTDKKCHPHVMPVCVRTQHATKKKTKGTKHTPKHKPFSNRGDRVRGQHRRLSLSVVQRRQDVRMVTWATVVPPLRWGNRSDLPS